MAERTCRMRMSWFYEVVEEKIGSVFARLGRVVSRHAWKIIIITIIVNGALGVGMMKLKSDNDAGNVYLPQGTQARKDQEKVGMLFPDLSATNYNGLRINYLSSWAKVIVRSTSGNLLSRATLEEIKGLHDIIVNITASDDDGNTFKFSDICAQAVGECAVDGDVVWSTEFLAAVDLDQVTYPLFTYHAGTTNYASDLGGKVTVDGGYLKGMEYMNIDFRFRTDEGYYYDLADKWVDAFKARMDTFSSKTFEIAYAHYNSLDEELQQNIGGDITFFSITVSLMITYACLATLSARITDQVGQRMWLGFGGALAAGLAIVSSFGLCAAAGVEFVSIVGVIPFLIIGIGIDDMFILLSGLSGAQNQKTVDDKMAETFRASGVGITITSLTDLIAFMAGAASNFVAVKNFCIYTAVAVAFCYINNITFFGACMAINERRVDGNIHYGTCRRIKTKEELREEGRSNRYIMCCGGRPPTSREEAESFIDKLPRWLLPKILIKTPAKIFICLLFMGYLAAAVYGCVHLKQGLKFTELVHEESYYHKFATWDEDHFRRVTPVAFITDSPYMYSDIDTQSLIDDLITSVQANDYFDNTFEVNWLKTYRATSHYSDTNEASFIAGLWKFIMDPKYASFANDVVIDSTNSSIVASRVFTISNDMSDSQMEGQLMLRSRDLADNSAFNCFAYYPAFVAYEQYVAILGQTLQTVGIALAAVFVVTCIFMPHPILITLCTVAVTMIMAGVFGFLLYLDVALSAITMIHLIMSIGFSIDFTAHICHGFMISDGQTRDIRVKQAIDKTGAPIFHGAISSILGIIVLVGAKSYIFRTFASVMTLVLVFGFAHALLLLPVILSWMGPSRLLSLENDSKKNGSSQNGEHYVFDNKVGADEQFTTVHKLDNPDAISNNGIQISNNMDMAEQGTNGTNL